VIPLQWIGFTLFGIIVYYLCDFPPSTLYFVYFYFVLLFSCLNSYFLAMFLAALTQNQNVALIVFPIIFLFLATFAGYAIPVDDVPPCKLSYYCVSIVLYVVVVFCANSSFCLFSCFILFVFLLSLSLFCLISSLCSFLLSTVWNWATYIDYARWIFEGMMVNQWEDYDDDSRQAGSVLDLYDFTNFNKWGSFWILAIATFLILVAVYLSMLPARKRLKKVTIEEMRKNSTISPEALNSLIMKDVENPMAMSDVSHGSLSLTSNSVRGGGGGGDGGGSIVVGGMRLTNQVSEANSFYYRNTITPTISRDIPGGRITTIDLQDGGIILPADLRKKSVASIQEKERASMRSLRDEYNSSFIQPLYGYYLTFSNLCYSVEVQNPLTREHSTLKVLTDVSGRIEPNEMCALMGSSGAGKSTLLDILADRKTVGNVTGNIFINGNLREKRMMKSTAYVMQDDIHIGCLSVYETLYYAALLRLPQTMTSVVKQQRIDEIMKVLGLFHISSSMVGDEKQRGISGGQKKRLSIGIEIIHKPQMIFLDEPTTGLDSAIAYEVMYAVRQIANQHRTIICTIHQPSTITFELFDKVILLGQGRVIYYGLRENIIDYFTNCVYSFRYENHMNPADYILAIASQAVSSPSSSSSSGSPSSSPSEAETEKEEQVSTVALIEMYEKSFIFEQFSSQIEEVIVTDASNYQQFLRNKKNKNKVIVTGSILKEENEGENEMIEEEKDKNIYHTSTLYQIRTLVNRLFLRKKREYMQTTLITGR
jgi:ABC-type multidrug transport system ATPase subunit